MVNGVILTASPLRSGVKQWCPLWTLIQHGTRISSQCNKARQGNKRHTAPKEEIFTDDKTVYVENHKKSI